MDSLLEARHLRLVVAISDAGSVTRAGKVLHLTQSAVSHQLAELESRLGFALFDRVGRCLKLTRKGQLLVDRGRQLLESLSCLERDLIETSTEPKELRVATQCFTCYHWLPRVLEPFESQHPGVRVELVVESTRHALQALEDDVIDLAITTETSLRPAWRFDPFFCGRAHGRRSPRPSPGPVPEDQLGGPSRGSFAATSSSRRRPAMVLPCCPGRAGFGGTA